jgi:hypothetical protein
MFLLWQKVDRVYLLILASSVSRISMLPNWQLKDRSVLKHLTAVDWVATGQAIAFGP